jgi:radical SAM protein with 4Fe4S-binding SPASM domain
VDALFTNVEIEINSHCNLACSYCPNSILERIEKGNMSPEIYGQIISQLKNLNFKGELSFSFYNEPLLCPDLEEFVSKAHRDLPEAKLIIYTNGTHLTAEKVTRLQEAGLSELIVTKHEDMNEYAFDEVFKSLSEKQLNMVTYRPFQEISMTNRGGLLPHIGESIPALSPCMIPHFLLSVTILGNVVACFEDYKQTLQMGNVMNEKLDEIWNKDSYQEFRKDLKRGLRHKYESCKNCNRVQVLPPS